MKALYNMFKKRCIVWGSIIYNLFLIKILVIVKFNYMFNNLFFDVWCMIKFGHHLTHIYFINNHCPSWG